MNIFKRRAKPRTVFFTDAATLGYAREDDREANHPTVHPWRR